MTSRARTPLVGVIEVPCIVQRCAASSYFVLPIGRVFQNRNAIITKRALPPSCKPLKVGDVLTGMVGDNKDKGLRVFAFIEFTVPQEIQTTVKFFDTRHGHGFLALPGPGRDAYFSGATLRRCGVRSLSTGVWVRAKYVVGPDGPEAYYIRRLD